MKIRFIQKYISHLTLWGLMLLVLASCEKFDFKADSSYARAFHPYSLAANNVTATSAVLEWPTVPGVKLYIVELSRDSLAFTNMIDTIQISSDTLSSSVDVVDLSLNDLYGNTSYSARVKTTSATGLPDSKYISATFKTKAEQILNPVGPTDKTSTSVTVSWPAGSAVTHFMVTPAGGTAQKYDISATEKTAGKKTITGLTAATNYTLDVYNTDANKRGSLSVVTYSNPPAAERTVWLTAADTLSIQTVMDTCTASSLTIVMPNGKYVFRSATDVALTVKAGLQAVNFYALPGTDTTKLKTKGITLPSALSMSAITFENLKVGGYDPTADYCFNPSTSTGTLSTVSFKNCQVRDFRGVLRVRGSITVSNFIVSNCIVANIKGYGLITMDSNSSPLVDNISLDGTTFMGMDIFIQSKYRNITSLNISNCTFYDMVNSGKYFFDFATAFAPATYTITNSIFSSIRFVNNSGTITYGNGYEGSQAPIVTNCYNTSDFIMTKGIIPNLTGYAGNAAALFTNPAAGNFAIKDHAFAGASSAGDPRWRLSSK
ncbi:MAG: DUF5123 domain-containing protein [Bacteroidota bacterium]|nr:DUF5123 domain-containing protein [Bacteroidota bacterium]MDP4273854.1 DUF5123 domain-containing protein [Bacteroidota bacterium]